MYLYVLVVVFTVYIMATKAHHYYLSQKWGCKAPTKASFGFMGLDFLRSQGDVSKLGQVLERQAKNFREIGHTFCTRIMGKKVIITSSADNMKAMLGTQFNDYGIGFRKLALQPLLGHGIFASDGARWKTSREMLRPQFAREQVAHLQTLEPHINNVIDMLKANGGHQVDLQEYFHKLTMDAASEFLFGESTNTLTSDAHNEHDFTRSFNLIQDTMTTRMMFGKLNFLIGGKEFTKNIGVVQGMVQYYVQSALKMSESELESKSKGGYVILYEVVKKTRDPIIIQDELLSMLLAGRNTTAGLLSFLFYELGKNPDVLEKLKQEISVHFGIGENVEFEKITFESMKRCSYLKYCINETLRLHPPVARNLRVALKNTTLPKGGGKDGESPIFISKGTDITFNIYQCHRETEVYGKDATTFRPERWETLKPGWSFMPFGSGPRICLGQQFALTEISYVTIRFLQNFGTVQSNFDEYPPRKIANATLRLMNGCVVNIH